ncbi:MAG: serine hydrolase domain-containing protein, partial [Caulobacter sp.]
VSAAVAMDGRLVWSGAVGEADLEDHTPATPATRFRIGSVSKVLTAVALMRLREAGSLDLDVPIQTYVPSFPVKDGGAVTARMLANHTSGLRHYQGREFLNQTHYVDMLTPLEIFSKDPLLSLPGVQFHYSSYGYNLLGAAIERASGQPFATYMAERVLAPLDMTHTALDDNETILENRARPYSFYDNGAYARPQGPLVNGPYVDNSNKWAGGGFVSTPSDLTALGSALLKPGFLTRESLDLLFTPPMLNGQPSGYGMGFFVAKAPDGQRLFFHNGTAVGGSSTLMILPDRKTIVAITINATRAPLTQADALALAAIFAP